MAPTSILVVDDDQDTCASMSDIISDLGYTVDTANDGPAALKRFEPRRHRLALLDYKMPGMDGLELCRHLKGTQPTVEIILVTAWAEARTLTGAAQVGVRRVLPKPVDFGVLIPAVEEVMELFRAKEQAGRQADQFRLLVQATKEYAIFMLDPEGHITTWNAGAERIKGYTADEIIGKHFSRFYRPEAIERRWPDHELEVARREGVYEEEGWRVRKDGSRFWASVVITALRDEAGQLLGFGKVTRVLTRRKEAEENARRLLQEEAARKAAEASALEAQRAREEERLQREQLHVTLTSIGDAVIVTDNNGTVTFLNPVAVGLTGWEPQEATGRPLEQIFRIVNEATRQPVENPVSKVLREGVTVGLANHTVLLGKNGQEIPIDDSWAPIRSNGGAIAGVVLVFRDITERHRTMEARLHLAAIVDSSDDAIVSKTLDGTIISWNQGAQRLYQYTAEEVVGKSISVLIPADTPDELPAIMEQLRRGERIEHYETVRVRKDGQRVAVSVSISPIRNAAGQVVAASSIVRDISERLRSRELTEIVRNKEQFISTFAHELGNSLTSIRLVLHDLLPGDDKTLNLMERQVHYMSRLVADLMDLSRIAHGKLQLQKERIELAAVVQRAVETAQPLIEAADQKLTVTVPPEPIYLEADLTRLTQVFVNLLNNSNKYTDRGGYITLSAEREGVSVVVKVRDNGMGITADLLPHVFDLFTQGPGASKKSQAGLGIGLTLVRQLVEMHGGSVHAHSDGADQGSEFTLHLPALETVPRQDE